MAKNAKIADIAPVVPTTSDEAQITTEAFGFTFDVGTAPRAALAYIVSFGFRQALSDATAGLGKAAAAALAAGGDEYAEYCADAGLDPNAARNMPVADFVRAVCDAARKARYDRIMSGTIGQRAAGAPRADKGEALAVRIATEWLRDAAKAKGKVLPKDKEAFGTLVANFRAKYAEKIAAEIARRASAPAIGDDFDL